MKNTEEKLWTMKKNAVTTDYLRPKSLKETLTRKTDRHNKI